MSDNLYLFADNNGGQAENNGSYRLYDMKIEGDSEGVSSEIDYVNYLQSDGNSWIDTEVPIITGYRVEVEIMKLKNVGSTYIPICGVGTPIYCSYGKDYADFGIGLIYSRLALKDENKEYYETQTEIRLNVKTTIKYTAKNVVSKHSLPLFTHGVTITGNFYTDSNLSDYARIYSFRIFDENNRLIQDLRPCLDTKGAPCMYDEVSKRYLPNKGTGTFKYKKLLRDFQPVLDSNNMPCLLDKINNKFYYNKSGEVFKTKEKFKYKKLKYLIGDGDNYIDLGQRTVDSNTKFEFKFQIPTEEMNSTIFRLYHTEHGAYSYKNGGLQYLYLPGKANYEVQDIKAVDNPLTVITTSTKNIIGDNVVNYTTTENFTNTENLYLFNTLTTNNAYKDKVKLYYFKMYNGEVLTLDLIPVVDQNNVPCMYDKVSDQFFYNQGTEQFGYEVEELEVQDKNYTEIEYIESNGTQYIDTGIVPNSNTDIDMICRLSAMPYYFSGWKTLVGIIRLTESFIVELDLKYSGEQVGLGDIVPDYLYVLSDGCYSLNGTDTTNIKVSTNKYDKVKIIANIEETKEYVYINNKLIGEKAISKLSEISFGGSYNNYSGCYTHYIDIYKLSDMSLLFSLKPVMHDYYRSEVDYTYKVPMLYNEINSQYYNSKYGDNWNKLNVNYGYDDDNYIYNKLKILNKYSIQGNDSSGINIYDKTVYEYNGVDTTIQPNLVASSGATLTLGSINLEKLNDDDIEIATNNGWSLT